MAAAPSQPRQDLPYWMSYMTYTTTSDGIQIVTDTIVRFPLTYYGPSIPLGPDWVYGGYTPVASIGVPAATPTEAPSTPTQVPPTTTQAPPPPPPSATPSPTLTSPGPTVSSAPGPTSAPTTPGTIVSNTSLSTSTPSTLSSTATSTTPSTSRPPSSMGSSTRTGTSTSAGTTGGSSSGSFGRPGLGPDAILGIVIGLIAFLFIFLFILFCCLRWRRRGRSSPGQGIAGGNRLLRTPRHMDFVLTRDHEEGGPEVMGEVGASPMRQRSGGLLFGHRREGSDAPLLHDAGSHPYEPPQIEYYDPSRGVYSTIYEDDEVEDEDDDQRYYTPRVGASGGVSGGSGEQRRSATSSGGSRTRPSAGGGGASINTDMFAGHALFFNPDEQGTSARQNPPEDRPNLPSPSNSTSDIHDYGTLLTSDDPNGLNFAGSQLRSFNHQHSSIDAHSSIIDPQGPNYPRVSPYDRVPYPDSPVSDSDEHTRLLNLLAYSSPPLPPHAAIPSSAGIPSPSNTALMPPLGGLAMARRSSSEPLPGSSAAAPPLPVASASQPNPSDPISPSTPPILTLRDFLDRQLPGRGGSPRIDSPMRESPILESPPQRPSPIRGASNESRSPDSARDPQKDWRGLKGGSTRTSLSSKRGGTSPGSIFGSLFSGWRGGGSGEGGAATSVPSSTHGHGGSATPPMRWPSGAFGQQQKPSTGWAGATSAWAPIAGASWAPSAWKPVPNNAQFTPPTQHPEPRRMASWISYRETEPLDTATHREVGAAGELTVPDTGNHRLTGYSSASTARGDLAAWQQVMRGTYANPTESEALRDSIYSTNPVPPGTLPGFGTYVGGIGDRTSALGLGDMLPTLPTAVQPVASAGSLWPAGSMRPLSPSKSALSARSADRLHTHGSAGSISGKSVYHDAASILAPEPSRAPSRVDDAYGADEDLPPMPVPYALPRLMSAAAASTYGLAPVQSSSSTSFAPPPASHVMIADLITPPTTPPRNFPGAGKYMSPFGTPTKTSTLPYPTLVATPYKRAQGSGRGESTAPLSPGAWMRSVDPPRPSQQRFMSYNESLQEQPILDVLLDMPPPPGTAWHPHTGAVTRRTADHVFKEATERRASEYNDDVLYPPPGLDSWNQRRVEDGPPEVEQDISDMAQSKRPEYLDAAPPSARPDWRGIRVVSPIEASRLRPNAGSSATAEENRERRLTFGQPAFLEPGTVEYLNVQDIRPLSPHSPVVSQPSSTGSRQSLFSTYSSHPTLGHRAPSLTAFGIAGPSSPPRATSGFISSSQFQPPPLPLPPSRVSRRLESFASTSPSMTEDHSRTLSGGETNWTRPTSLGSATTGLPPPYGQENRASWSTPDFSLVRHSWGPPDILEDLKHTSVAAMARRPSPLSQFENEEQDAQYLTLLPNNVQGNGQDGTPPPPVSATGGKEWDDVMRLLQG